MRDLRTALIKLAHENPSLRRDLLPVIKQAETAPMPPINVGDIFVAEWGYDQTNIDFYQVVALKAKAVVIRKIEQTVVRSSGQSDYVMPAKNRFDGQPLLKIPKSGYKGVALKITNYAWAYPWDGKPEAQTAPGYGH